MHPDDEADVRTDAFVRAVRRKVARAQRDAPYRESLERAARAAFDESSPRADLSSAELVREPELTAGGVPDGHLARAGVGRFRRLPERWEEDGERLDADTESRRSRVPTRGVASAAPRRSAWDKAAGLVAAAAVVVLVGVSAVDSPDAPRHRLPVVSEVRGIELRTEPHMLAPSVNVFVGYLTPIEVLCHTTGPEATGWGGKSTTWDRVRIGGTTGFVPDVSVNTYVAVEHLAPACPAGD